MKNNLTQLILALLLLLNCTAARAADTWGASGSQASLNANALTNGDFASGSTGWTVGTGWTISGNVATHSGSLSGILSRTANDVAISDGSYYLVEWKTSGTNTANSKYRVKVNGVHVPSYATTEEEVNSGAYFDWGGYLATTTGNVSFAIEADANMNFSFDDITIKRVSGGTAEALLNDSAGSEFVQLFGLSSKNNLFAGIGSGKHTISSLASNYGGDNTAMGKYAMYQNMSGSENSAFGYLSLSNNYGGQMNSAYGVKSLYNNTAGFQNTAIGVGAMHDNTVGSYNTALGYGALYNQENGTVDGAIHNVALGVSAMGGATSPGSYNVAIGTSALSASGYEGSHAVAIGIDALKACTTGEFNQAVGADSMETLTTGSNNSCFGHQCMNSTTDAGANACFGYQCLLQNTQGQDNACLGYHCLQNISGTSSSTSKNTAIGVSACSNLTSGRENICIGSATQVPNSTGNYQGNIGDVIYLDRDDATASIGQTAPETNAILTLTSTSKPLLLPRMTTTQQNAVSSPVNGMLIYNSTTGKFTGYAGGAWVALH